MTLKRSPYTVEETASVSMPMPVSLFCPFDCISRGGDAGLWTLNEAGYRMSTTQIELS